MHLYDEFLGAGLNVLVYSGDVDAIVPYTGSRQWISQLNRLLFASYQVLTSPDRPILEPWRPYLVNNQVGGYITVYKGLTFATVRNAGKVLISSFWSNQLFFRPHGTSNTT